VTAESEQKNVIEAVQAGVSDYVVKPFTPVTLKGKLENVFNRHNKKAA
jgi:two-component system chemotaxis response regulator CheY